MDLDVDDGLVAELTEQDKTDIAKQVLDLSETNLNKLLEHASPQEQTLFRAKIATCREIADVIPSVREKIKNTLKSKPQAVPVLVIPHVGVAEGGNAAGPDVAANAGFGVGVNEEDEENVDMDVDEAKELKKRQNKILGRLRRYIRAWDVIFHLKETGYLNDTQQTFVLKEFVFAYILNDKKALNSMFDNAGSPETKKYSLPNVNADNDDYAKQIAKLVFSICYAENEYTEKMTSDETIKHVLDSGNAYKKLSFMVNLYTDLTGDNTLQSLQAGSIDADNDDIEKDIGVVEGNNFDEDIAGDAPSQVSGGGSSSSSSSSSGSGASVRRGASLSGNGGGSGRNGGGSGRSGRGSASASRGGDGENRAANVGHYIAHSIYSAPSASHGGGGSAGRGAGGGSGLPSSTFSGVNPSLASLSYGSVRSSSLVAVDPLRSAHAIDAANAVDFSNLLGASREEDEDVVENDISAAGGGGEGAAVGDKRNTEGDGSFAKNAKRLRTRLSFPKLIVEATSKLIQFNELGRSTQVSLKPETFNTIKDFTDAVKSALTGTETDDNRAVLEELLDINFPAPPAPPAPPALPASKKSKRPRQQTQRFGFLGGRHFAMRAASFQRSRIAAILNSLYPIAV